MERGPVVRANVYLLSDRRQVAYRDRGDRASFKSDVLGMFPSEEKKALMEGFPENTGHLVSMGSSSERRSGGGRKTWRLRESAPWQAVVPSKRVGTRVTEGVWSEEEYPVSQAAFADYRSRGKEWCAE